MTQLFSNNAEAALAAQMAVGANTLVVENGKGALFREPSNPDYELLTLTNGLQHEVVKVTDRTVDVFTVVRAQEGTTAKQWETGELVSARVTRVTMETLQAAVLQSVADAAAALAATAILRPPEHNYGDQGSNFTLDLALGETIRVHITGDVAITLSNATKGWATRIVITQDGTGGHTVTLPNVFAWVAGMAPILTTEAGKTDVVGILYTDTTTTDSPYLLGVSYALDI